MFETRAEMIVAVMLVLLSLLGGGAAWYGLIWWSMSLAAPLATVTIGAASAAFFGTLAWVWLKAVLL